LPEIVWLSPAKFDQQILNEIQSLIREYETKHQPKETQYNERATGQGLIEPLLQILGWNTHDLDEVYPEYYVTGSGRVDYVLKINKIPVIYLEIKKLSESLDGCSGSRPFVDQAMDYAWKKRATWAVLTNFKELRLYNAKERLLVFQIPYLEYTSKFEGSMRYLTKSAMVKGEIGQLYALKAGKEIDEDFLNDLQKWRLDLASDIHKHNKLVLQQTSFQTQKILNRLILIRIAEDRGALPRGQLKNEYLKWKNTARSRRKKFFDELKESFLDFEFDFNTELFKPDICDSFVIDDSVFKDLMEHLYDYDFSTLTGDILGSTYELYLGYSLEPVNKDYEGQDIVPQDIPLELVVKKEYRQREGIFYTRPPVVDFIISQTVLKIIAPRNDEQLKELKVLDGAGGSGSFLIKALIAIRNHFLKESVISRRKTVGDLPLYTETSSVALDDIPKLVLSNNLYLVDLDPQSVEIAKLNLWAQALHPKYGQEKVLLDLDKKFKCGNSLVFADRTDLLKFFSNDSVLENEIRPFDWHKEFPEVFVSRDGFDAIVGNPPYYSVHFLDTSMKDYLGTYYKDIHTGQNDILYYFYHRGIELLKENGLLGFITARYFLEARDADKLRSWILDSSKIRTIVDFGNIDMFGGLGTRTAVLVLEKSTGPEKQKNRASNIIQVAKVKCRRWSKPKRQLISLIEQHLGSEDLYEDAYIKTFNIKQNELASTTWVLVPDQEKALKKKIESRSVFLGELCHCGKGMETGLNEVEKDEQRLGVFHLTSEEVEKLEIEPEILRRLVKNSDIDRYLIDYKDLYLLYLTDEQNIAHFPHAEAHLNRFRTELKKRYGFDKKNRMWYAISTARNRELFDNAREKLICPYISPENRFGYDSFAGDQKFYSMTDTTIVVPKEGCSIDLKFILAVLNSTTSNFYYRTYAKPKDYRYEYFSETINKMCVPDLDKIGGNSHTIYENIIKITSEMLKLRSKQNSIRKSYLKVLRDNLADTTCCLKDYYESALKYSFHKNVLLDQDIEVESCEIELSKKGNSILVKAYFDEEWHDIITMVFEDPDIRDFVYLAIDSFVSQKETSVSWRRGKIISGVFLGIEVPRLETNHEENSKKIHTIMAEIKYASGISDLGEITAIIRDIDNRINEEVYKLYDIDTRERTLIENSIDYRRPYLRY
jgi:hypothetical protein